MQDVTNPFLNFLAKTSLFFAAIAVFALVNMLFYGAFMRLVFNAFLPYLNLNIIAGFLIIIGFLTLGSWFYRGGTSNSTSSAEGIAVLFRIILPILALILSAGALLYGFKNVMFLNFEGWAFLKDAYFYQITGLITSAIFLASSALIQLTAAMRSNSHKKTQAEYNL